MSAKYVPVSWNRSKIVYDLAMAGAVASYLVGFLVVGETLQNVRTPLDEQTLRMRAFGTCAFLMMSAALAIGPLARLDKRFLPLLYNRRHLGVATCLVALCHAYQVIDWYFVYSPLAPLEALLATDTSFGRLRGFPFIPFGIVALLVLCLLAATSHDFWLSFLGAPLWKALHMSLYGAYALVVLHMSFGVLQDARDWTLPGFAAASAFCLVVLHSAAAFKARRGDLPNGTLARGPDGRDWVDAGPFSAFSDSRARIVTLADDEPVAIFRHENRLTAVTNVCAHQNGPLGEGRVVDGCITCPWHGFQYRLEDGCAPPPFTEKIATYNLSSLNGRVLLDPRANPRGTPTVPLSIPVEAQ
jgi:nitrite reductase/ring-hydroxylating ferredoxin subunit/DMSO/TMAO reductase YedYZ heme-binding membrane subunit